VPKELTNSEFHRVKLVHVTPHPTLPRFCGANQRVSCCTEVFRRMFVLGRIAATYMTTAKTEAEVHPPVPHLHALFTNVRMSTFNFYLIEMRAVLNHATSFLKLRGPTWPDQLRRHRFVAQIVKFRRAAIERGEHRHTSENIRASGRSKSPDRSQVGR